MNKKSLLLVFSIVAVVSCGLMGEEKKTRRTDAEQNEIKSLLCASFDEHNTNHIVFRGCIETRSNNCDLILKHLKNARDHRKQQGKIKDLASDMQSLSSEQTRRPVKNRLDKAKKECPTCDKNYWATLSTETQDSLIDAAAEIAEGENHIMSWNINKLTEVLNK